MSTLAQPSLTWRIVRAVVGTVVVILAFAAVPVVTPILVELALRAEFIVGIRWAIGVIAFVAGVVAIRSWLLLVFHRVDRQAAVVLKNLGAWALYACLALAILTLLGIDLSGLLVGGAIFGVVIGAAAQSSLGNFFAGILLMLSRPFEVGVTLRVRSQMAAAIEYEGTVADTNALFTTLRTTRGELLRLPNSAVLNAALTVGKPPLQGSLQVTLDAGVSLSDLRTAIRDRLGDRGAEVLVTPISLASATAAAPATVVCQIEVRSRRQLDPGVLTEAVAAAATAPTPTPTPESARV